MSQSISYLIFSVGEYRFAIKADEVIEVTRMVALESVPGLNTSVRGIFSLRGSTVYCVDLNAILGEAETPYGTGSRIIVIRQNDIHIGFMAITVHGVQLITDEIQAKSSAVPDHLNIPFVRTVFHTEDGFLFELNPEMILSSDNLHAVPDLDTSLSMLRK